MRKGNVRYQKVRRFSRNKFWKNIGCLVSGPTFGLGVWGVWYKKEAIKIREKNSKRRSINIKVCLYEVFLSYFIYFLLFYFVTILTPCFFARFVVSVSHGEISS